MTLIIVTKDSQLFTTKGRGRMMKASSTDGDAKSDGDESAALAPSIEPSMTLTDM